MTRLFLTKTKSLFKEYELWSWTKTNNIVYIIGTLTKDEGEILKKVLDPLLEEEVQFLKTEFIPSIKVLNSI